MTSSDIYLLGRREAEEARLRRQILDLAPDSEWMFAQMDIRPGEHVVDMGCGPGGTLHLLAARVGPQGTVLGIERSPRFAELARRFVADQGLANVEVREGDAYATGLKRGAFDGAHMRLVLVNVPRPEAMLAEMVALVRPGGWVAGFEADYYAHICHPPLPAWDRLMQAYSAFSAAQGIDLLIGRRLPLLYRGAGLVDIRVEPVVHAYPAGHSRRTIFHDFIGNVREPLLAGGHIGPTELDADLAALERHLADPEVLVLSHLFVRVWGRVPG